MFRYHAFSPKVKVISRISIWEQLLKVAAVYVEEFKAIVFILLVFTELTLRLIGRDSDHLFERTNMLQFCKQKYSPCFF